MIFVPAQVQALDLYPIGGGTTPVGIAYYVPTAYVPSGGLILSVNYQTGSPYNLAFLATDGSIGRWGDVSGVVPPGPFGPEEIKVCAVQSTVGGFTAGQVFLGNAFSGGLGRIMPDGTTTLDWIRLPGAALGEVARPVQVYQGSDIPAFQNKLIAVGNKGSVWLVTSAGSATKLAQVSGNWNLESGLVIPNNSGKYGPQIAGKLLVGGDESTQSPNGKTWTVTTAGVVTELAVQGSTFRAEDLDLISSSQGLFVTWLDGGFYGLHYAPAGTGGLNNYNGDILVTQEWVTDEAPGRLLVLRWNGAQLQLVDLQATDVVLGLNPWKYEHSTFASYVPPYGRLPVVSIEAVDNVAQEDPLAQDTGEFRIHRTGDLFVAFDANFELPAGAGLANLGLDYFLSPELLLPLPYHLQIPSGASELSVVLTAYQDTRTEGDEDALIRVLDDDPVYRAGIAGVDDFVTIIDDPVSTVPPNLTFTLTPVAQYGAGSLAYTVNSSAQVAGFYYRYPYEVNNMGFLYQGGGLTLLNPGGGYEAIPYSISEESSIVVGGIHTTSSSYPNAFLWTQASGFYNLYGLGGYQTIAYAISPDGAGVVGASVRPQGYFRAVYWFGNQAQSMGTVALQGDSALRNSYAMGIAFLPDLLEYRVVGKSQNSAGLYRAFMVPYATALDESDDLGTLAGTGSSEAADVNDLSEFAGSSTVPGGQYHAVYHSPTTLPNLGFVDLGTLPGGAYSNGKGINNSGHIVGTSTTPTGGRAVLWFNNGTKKNLGLNEPGVPGNVGNLAGWTLITAEEISNSGHIVGFGSYNGAT